MKGARGDTSVVLNDAQGNSVEQGDIAAGQTAMSLTAPTVTSESVFYVMANVSDGNSQQTLVKKLTVRPQ